MSMKTLLACSHPLGLHRFFFSLSFENMSSCVSSAILRPIATVISALVSLRRCVIHSQNGLVNIHRSREDIYFHACYKKCLTRTRGEDNNSPQTCVDH